MGGGTILILLLSLFFHVEQNVAQATNLVFFIPTAISAIFIGIRSKNIEWKEALPIVISGIIGAIIASSISSKMQVNILKKCFGTFLLCIAIYEIYSWYRMYIKEKLRHNKSRKKL